MSSVSATLPRRRALHHRARRVPVRTACSLRCSRERSSPRLHSSTAQKHIIPTSPSPSPPRPQHSTLPTPRPHHTNSPPTTRRRVPPPSVPPHILAPPPAPASTPSTPPHPSLPHPLTPPPPTTLRARPVQTSAPRESVLEAGLSVFYLPPNRSQTILQHTPRPRGPHTTPQLLIPAYRPLPPSSPVSRPTPRSALSLHKIHLPQLHSRSPITTNLSKRKAELPPSPPRHAPPQVTLPLPLARPPPDAQTADSPSTGLHPHSTIIHPTDDSPLTGVSTNAPRSNSLSLPLSGHLPTVNQPASALRSRRLLRCSAHDGLNLTSRPTPLVRISPPIRPRDPPPPPPLHHLSQPSPPPNHPPTPPSPQHLLSLLAQPNAHKPNHPTRPTNPPSPPLPHGCPWIFSTPLHTPSSPPRQSRGKGSRKGTGR